MKPKLVRITEKKAQLDQHQPLPQELINNLEEWLRVELTYTSNALEGNTLTRQETALVVEKGITVGGKTLREHLEATNHAKAFDYLRKLAEGAPTPSPTPPRKGEGAERLHHPITENELLQVHRLILEGIDDLNAGRYRRVPVRIAGSIAIMPNPLKVPELMTEFIAWLQSETSRHPVDTAAEAHYRLVSIHPFIDGNGRTARLLMNFLLRQAGYPTAIIRPEDRQKYITALENRQTSGEATAYQNVIYDAVERSLDIYLDAISKIG